MHRREGYHVVSRYGHPAVDDAIEDRIGIGAAASALGVSVDTLRRWERDGGALHARRRGPPHPARPPSSRALLRERHPGSHQSARNRLDGHRRRRASATA